MNEKRIGAVAVVNNSGSIIGNFSAADMRHDEIENVFHKAFV